MPPTTVSSASPVARKNKITPLQASWKLCIPKDRRMSALRQ
jgi:hypothetical protein